MIESKYHIWLSLACGAGEPGAVKLLDEFGTAENVYLADKEEYVNRYNFKNSAHLIDRLLNKDMTEVEKILEFCLRNNVSVLNCDSSLYPKRLKGIRSYPIVLYYKGRLIDVDDNLCITMVGTRKMTNYGKMSAYELAKEFADCGAVIVSGMADGIDAASHKGCLVQRGFTIAVLGCGIDIVYPLNNKTLMDKIIERGLIVTEYPPHTEPRGKNFPVRNRIMTGLSQAVLVVEADDRSGSLITARLALAEGREVYAVPGNISSMQSRGTNRLIKNGAGLVMSAYDILSEYEHIYSHRINMENSAFYKSGAYAAALKRKNYAGGADGKNAEENGNRTETGDKFKIEKHSDNKSSSNSNGNSNEEQGKNRDKDEIKNVTVLEIKGEIKEETSPEETLKKMEVSLNAIEMEVFKVFYRNKNEKLHPDEINIEDIPKADIINTLTFLELYGLITSHPGDYFSMA